MPLSKELRRSSFRRWPAERVLHPSLCNNLRLNSFLQQDSCRGRGGRCLLVWFPKSWELGHSSWPAQEVAQPNPSTVSNLWEIKKQPNLHKKMEMLTFSSTWGQILSTCFSSHAESGPWGGKDAAPPTFWIWEPGTKVVQAWALLGMQRTVRATRRAKQEMEDEFWVLPHSEGCYGGILRAQF